MSKTHRPRASKTDAHPDTTQIFSDISTPLERAAQREYESRVPPDDEDAIGFRRRAVIYTRVSTQDQAENGRSLENQLSRLRAFAAAHSYNIFEEVCDEARSGQKTNRVGFQRVLSMIETRSVNAVIVYSLSRFARNTVATLEAVRLMRDRDVSFLSLTENIDTSSAAGEFFLTVLAAFAQLEAKTASERIKSVMEMKKMRGEHTGNPPFGWRKIESMLVIDDYEQEIIAAVRDMRQKKFSLAEIARQLKKAQYRNRAGNTEWQKTQVARILKQKP